MRIFWALIALLVLLAAGLVVFRTPTVRTPVAPAPAPVTMPAVTPDAAATAATAPTAAPVEAEKPASATDAAPQATAADLAAAAEAEQAMLDAIAEKHSGPKHAAKAARPTIDTPGAGSDAAKTTEATATQPPADAPVGTPTRAPAKLGEYVVTPATFRDRGDGALVVDEQYIVRGEGTAEKPFVVSWEMLVASEGDFDPSKGKNTIPERVAMLHGKIVSITGYVAFPLMTPKPTELLMMLNQWDGCCMGVPPTPYDAIEVKINKAVTGDARFAINGTVRGTFKVEPYVTKTPTVSWLNGLYLMENAEFAAADIGAGAGS
ncbi:MAG: hypothetical protein ACK5ZG_03885 [Phycisphaerae bacterium]|jgi:hypothetical protein